MDKKLRIGLIGLGARGSDLLPHAILPVEDAEVTEAMERILKELEGMGIELRK